MRAWIRWPFLKLEKVIQFSHKFASQKNRGCEPFVFPLMPGTLNSIAANFLDVTQSFAMEATWTQSLFPIYQLRLHETAFNLPLP